jgi:glycerol-3-phosphate dehydrogenase (NAD(P)+)
MIIKQKNKQKKGRRTKNMIGVIGAGSWGTALSIVLANNTSLEFIPLWARNSQQLCSMREQRENNRYLPTIPLPGKIVFLNNLQELVEKVQDIFIVVPSKAFAPIIQQIKPYINSNHRIAWATKGIDPTTGDFLSELVQKELGNTRPCAVLSGPSFAYEVANGLPTAVTVASNDKMFLQDMVSYFHVNYFRVYTSTDLIGVQLGGVVKNIFAVAAGIADGLGFGANARAALITRGLVEMQRLGKKLGVTPETITGLSGLGDMILTCTDDQSRNRRFGLALAEGKTIEEAQQSIGQVVEAVHNTSKICEKAVALGIEIPIANQIDLILKHEITPQQAVHNLITRKPVREI